MNKLKVLTVVGTRPELIRLSRVIAKLNESTAINHVLIHTGQNYDYELNGIFFDDLEIKKPDYFLEAAGKSPSETIGQILIKIEPILEREKPDAFLILGDTNSCLCAIPAKKHHIPIFHMEAGNRCFDARVPEETNRKIVDHISDINLTYSSIAREYLLAEGVDADRVIKTGSPMYEVLHYYLPKIERSDILMRLELKEREFFVVSAHREENVDNPAKFNKLIQSLNSVAEKYNYPLIVSTHPRTRNVIKSSAINVNPKIRFLKPLGFIDYNHLQLNAYATLSDSGTISEESSILNFPALNIRESHERPEAMEEASVILTGLSSERILQGLEQLQFQIRGQERNVQEVEDYRIPNLSEKIVRIIISYVDYIRRVVWNDYE